MNTLRFQLITPEKTVLDTELVSLSLPTSLGQITILPGHVPLVVTLFPGELVMKTDQSTEYFHVGGGVAKIEPNSKIVVLADAAEHVAEIDEARAEEAARAAKMRLVNEQLSDREYAATASLLERNLARLRLTRKHSHARRAPVTSEGVLEE